MANTPTTTEELDKLIKGDTFTNADGSTGIVNFDYKTGKPLEDARYARTPSSYDSQIANTTDALNQSVGPAPSLAAITASKQGAAQGMISAITAEFNRVLEEQNKTNAGYNDRVRAMNVSSGLGGSDFATAKAIDQENKNKKAIDLINEEKTSKIASILSDVDQRSSAEYQQQRQDYIRGLGDNLDRLKQAKEDDRNRALDSIKSLASQNVSIEKVKSSDPTTYGTLLKEYGGSQLDLETAWNDSLPDEFKTKYDQEIIKGKNGNATVLRYGINPATGTVDKKTYDLGVNYDSYKGEKPIEAGGRLYTRNSDGSLTPLTSANDSGNSPKGSIKSGKAVFTPEQMSSFSTELEKSKSLFGGDGKYVNPEVYLQAYEAWTDPEVGGLAKDFLAQFPPNKYVNPANNTLPEYLRSGNKTSTIAPKSTSGREF